MIKLDTYNALLLYECLREHIPDDIGEESILSILGKIVDKIAQEEKYEDYIKVVTIVTTLDEKDIIRLRHEEVLNAVAEALYENRFLDLIVFVRELTSWKT